MANETEILAPVIRQAVRQWHVVERRQRKHLEAALKAKSELEVLDRIINMQKAVAAA